VNIYRKDIVMIYIALTTSIAFLVFAIVVYRQEIKRYKELRG